MLAQRCQPRTGPGGGVVHLCVGHAGAQWYDNGFVPRPGWVAYEVGGAGWGAPQHPAGLNSSKGTCAVLQLLSTCACCLGQHAASKALLRHAQQQTKPCLPCAPPLLQNQLIHGHARLHINATHFHIEAVDSRGQLFDEAVLTKEPAPPVAAAAGLLGQGERASLLAGLRAGALAWSAEA